MKSIASLILLAMLTTMSGIRFALGRGIIDRIAKEQGCGRTMELQLCWHHFLEKNRTKGIRRSSRWKAEYNRPIEERKWWSTGLADGQGGSTLAVGQRVRAIGRRLTRRSVDGREEGGIQRDTPKGKHGGGGSIHDWQRVKSWFLEGLRLLRESFSIFSSFCL
jgi:hypothetical protein